MFSMWKDFLATCISLLPCLSKVWLGMLKSIVVGVLHKPCCNLYGLFHGIPYFIDWTGEGRIQDFEKGVQYGMYKIHHY